MILKSLPFGPKFAIFERFLQVAVTEQVAFQCFNTTIWTVCRKAAAALQRGRRCMTTGLPLRPNGVLVVTP